MFELYINKVNLWRGKAVEDNNDIFQRCKQWEEVLYGHH